MYLERLVNIHVDYNVLRSAFTYTK